MELTTFALVLLVSISLAAPVAESPTKPFTLTTAHHRRTFINCQEINADSQALYLGLASPGTYCPAPGTIPLSDCPAGNETVFEGLLSMDVEVPGGQLAYVAANGALGYTQAHSATIPPGAFTKGFSWTHLFTTSITGEVGELDFKATASTKSGFLACPDVPTLVPGATYQIFAFVPGFSQQNCIDLGRLKTTEYKAEEFGAWQYT